MKNEIIFKVNKCKVVCVFDVLVCFRNVYCLVVCFGFLKMKSFGICNNYFFILVLGFIGWMVNYLFVN